MDSSDDFQSQQQKIQAALVAVNRTVNSITREDLTFQRTVNPDIASRLDDSSARLLRFTNSLLKSAALATSRKLVPPTLEDAEDVDLHWPDVVNVIDSLLEKADTTLDEYTGILKRHDAPTVEVQKKPKPTTERLDWSLRRADIPKPQLQFERQLSFTDPNAVWVPQLTAKPHLTVSLPKSLCIFRDEFNRQQYKHPYEQEIMQMKYPESVYKKRDPIPYLPTDTTAATYVDTFEGVEAMLAELREADEIAVDLEHHDYRTYAGLLSLMQISTRHKDWIVDTLQPWRHKLEILNEVFADPAKIKVFHGATSDIVWLQRDLGLYIVGLFDTYFACECLAYPQRSLAFLLKRFVDFDADKKYQMADWRIRPIPEEMLYYARSDTHFLLYVYDMVRNELADKSAKPDADKNLTDYVLQKSKETSLLRFDPPYYDWLTGQGNRGWYNSFARSYAVLNGDQFSAFKALFDWRDRIARTHDESPGYILPMKQLLDIARILPPDEKALLGLLKSASPIAKKATQDILGQIRSATTPRAIPNIGSMEFLRAVGSGASREELANLLRGSPLPVPLSPTASSSSRAPASSVHDIGQLRTGISQLLGPTICTGPRTRRRAPAPATPTMPTQFSWWAGTCWPPSEPVTPSQRASPALLPTASTFSPARRASSSLDSAASPEPAVDPVAVTAAEPAKQSDSDEVFTLNVGRRSAQKGAKRSSDETGSPSQKKKKKKNKDRQTTSKQGGQSSQDSAETSPDSDGGAPLDAAAKTDDEFLPFDYDAAKSVLHAKKDESGSGSGSGRKKAFDPYKSKMGADGPKAARRMHFEKTGKSGTFKK